MVLGLQGFSALLTTSRDPVRGEGGITPKFVGDHDAELGKANAYQSTSAKRTAAAVA